MGIPNLKQTLMQVKLSPADREKLEAVVRASDEGKISAYIRQHIRKEYKKLEKKAAQHG